MRRRAPAAVVFVLTLLEVLGSTRLTSYEGNGFIPNNDAYLADDISALHEELASDSARSSSVNMNIKHMIRFKPEFLDFKQRPLGVPHLEKVTLFNVDSNRTIDMTSISGSTVHFHSSFFEDKKIPPLGNTTFNVVFLGREEGFIESNLFIHTTEGHFQYQVKGASVYSPYRLRPIVGVKLPLNASFSPLIYVHNPHSEPIQIVEMYSSGGDFHLELPSGELEGPKDMWEIPPLQTKAVIRVRFNSKVEQNHTAYVRIKLNNTEEILIVPLEVEVSSNAGLFSPQGYVDFGVGGSLDPPKKVKLQIYNPLKKAIRIHSVYTSSKAIKVKFESVRIPSTSSKSGKYDVVDIATLTLDWKTAYSERDYSGKIVVKYRNGKSQIEIPYYITIVEGGISYNSSSLKYFIGDTSDQLKTRSFSVRNDFADPLTVINVHIPLDVQQYFQVSNFKPTVLKPKEEKVIFSLKAKAGVDASTMRLNSHVLLKTNVSVVEIPLLSYDGKLFMQLPYKSKDNSLDLGLLSLESRKDTYVLFVNKNPIKIAMSKVFTSLPSSQVSVIGCNNGDYRRALLQESFVNMSKCTYLRPMDYTILKLSVKTSSNEGQIWGDVSLTTQYEHISIPVHFKVAAGKLEIGPDKLYFDQCFPGKICSHPLKVLSTFSEPMVIEDIFSMPPDNRIFTKHTGHILARATKIIGHIYLDPSIGCKNDCYTSISEENEGQWLKSLALPKSTADLDLNLVNVLYNRYITQTADRGAKWQNITMRLDSSEVKGYIFRSRVKMLWPSLVSGNSPNKTIVNFPLTQVGNVSYRNITFYNPSSHNLVLQLIMDEFYPNIETLREGLPQEFIPNYGDDEGGKKRVLNKNRFNMHESFRHCSCEEFAEEEPHEETQTYLLCPGENVTVTVAFYGLEPAGTNTALLIVRNNLTIVEVVRLNAKATYPSFKFGNRKPGSSLPLTFELTEKHLKDCEREKSKKYQSSTFSVKRSFTARNTGEITVYVYGFLINGLKCEGYGFKVLNCAPFELPPNGTRKIDIAFTPDFTLAKITRSLILSTSLSIPVNYTLVTTIPSFYLDMCAGLVARPSWESYLYYVALVSTLSALVFVIVLPVMESERIVNQTMTHLARNPPTEPLDLRSIGTQAKIEIRPNKATTSDELSEGCAKNSDKPAEKKPSEEVKKEPEKYTALVPTIGKGRKKLGLKRNNNNFNNNFEAHEHELPPQTNNKNKQNCESTTKKKLSSDSLKEEVSSKKTVVVSNVVSTQVPSQTSTTTSTHIHTKTAKTKSEAKKPPDPKPPPPPSLAPTPAFAVVAAAVESQALVGGEEEVKTTIISDGRSNSEDNINIIKPTPVVVKKPPPPSQQVSVVSKPEAGSVAAVKVVLDVVETKSHTRLERKRSQPKTKESNNKVTSNKENKLVVDENKPETITSVVNKKSSDYSNGKPKGKSLRNKDKLANNNHKKHAHEKNNMCGLLNKTQSTTSDSSTSPQTISTSPSSAVLTSSIWSENRASFSDVVARNENGHTVNVNVNPPLKPLAVQAPSVYLESYNNNNNKKSPTDLGPIGSKRVDYYATESSTSNDRNTFNVVGGGGVGMPVVEDPFAQNKLFFNDVHNLAVESTNAFFDNNWQSSPSPLNISPTDDLNSNGFEPADDPWMTTNCTSGFWDYSCPLTNPVVHQPSTPNYNTHSPNNYLWGSSNIWHPWVPDPQPPPPPPLQSTSIGPRTPPGFGPSPTRETEERQPPTYNPFGSSSIWAQQSNPWNYPQGQ